MSKYFLVGVKGVGMTGIAILLKEQGHEVMGSDTSEPFFTDAILEKSNIRIVSFDPEHVSADINEVIFSSAYNIDHPQLQKVKTLGIKTISYNEALARMFNQKTGILVIGTHGKTTSTAMLARILEDAGLDPSVLVGGELVEWGKTARNGSGTYMVAEGDEYQAKILDLRPRYVLLTNIEYDHPDFYKTEEEYFGVFRKFLENLSPDAVVVAPNNLESFVSASTKVKTIFFNPASEPHLQLSVWGRHNQTNAQGVIKIASRLGIPERAAQETLKKFRGTKRRMELYTPEGADVVIVDDYGHHPTEIRATLLAIKSHFPERKLTVYFQPHTYSRTQSFVDDFASSFDSADHVVILDVYGSAREKNSSFDIQTLIEKTKKHHPSVEHVPNIEEGLAHALQKSKTGSVIVTMGAGDVWRIADGLAKKLTA